MTRTRIPVSNDAPVVNDLVSSPSSTSSQSSTVTFTGDASPVRKKRNRLLQYKHHNHHHPRLQQQQQQQQQQHVVTKTLCRHTSLFDDIETPSVETTMATTTATATITATISSPQRASSAAAKAVSPKLSPISHASSTARQQEQEHQHRQQDQREPASPFKKSHKQPVDDGKASSNDLNCSHSVASHSHSHNEAQPKSSVQQDGNASTTNVADNDADFVDLSDLFLMLQRREWENVYAFLEQHPTSSRQTIHSKKGTTPLLHIVLRHGPPLPVVDMLLTHQAMLLTHQATTTTTASEIWKQTDTNGRLPLHAACSCGPDACLDVISRLISADPDALRIRTKDQHSRYPLHIAVVTNASEDVVMELMIHSPDVSFQPDAHGKLPIEYAQDSCYGHNRLVVALEMAPMFLAASQAAYKRAGTATETKLESLREAHTSYEEQLEDRYNSEKMVLVKEQIECSNELTNEKERNIALAETMIEMKKSEKDLIGERDVLKSKLGREILKRKTRTKVRDEELKKILLGKKEKSDESRKGENEKENGDKKKTSGEDKKLPGGGGDDHPSSSNLPLPRLLKWVSAGYENSKRRNELYKKKLEKQRAATRDLNVLLATKEAELKQAHRKTRSDEIRLQAALDRTEDLAEKHESALAKFSTAREEAKRLKNNESEREQKLAYSKRRLRIQERRLSGVQDLIESLMATKGNHAERLGLIQEVAEREKSGCDESSSNNNDGRYDRSHALSAASPFAMLQKDAELSVDLSIEIEMAAMAAAHLDDGSVCTSPSERRREADLSLELAAATNAMDYNRPPTYENEYTVVKGAGLDRGKSSPEQQPVNRNGTNWDMNKLKNWISVTPQTLSITTGTTASCGENGFCDHALARSVPETPPIPEQVRSGSRQEYDQFSPLGTPQLEFTED